MSDLEDNDQKWRVALRMFEKSQAALRELIPTDEDVENYIRSLPWSDRAEEYEKTLVAGNIRGFVTYLRTRSGKLEEEILSEKWDGESK